jgi:hypothetical protein
MEPTAAIRRGIHRMNPAAKLEVEVLTPTLGADVRGIDLTDTDPMQVTVATAAAVARSGR